MEEKDKVYTLADGEVALWWDGCVCIKAYTKDGDPVELMDDDALELAEILKKAGRRASELRECDERVRLQWHTALARSACHKPHRQGSSPRNY